MDVLEVILIAECAVIVVLFFVIFGLILAGRRPKEKPAPQQPVCPVLCYRQQPVYYYLPNNAASAGVGNAAKGDPYGLYAEISPEELAFIDRQAADAVKWRTARGTQDGRPRQ